MLCGDSQGKAGRPEKWTAISLSSLETPPLLRRRETWAPAAPPRGPGPGCCRMKVSPHNALAAACSGPWSATPGGRATNSFLQHVLSWTNESHCRARDSKLCQRSSRDKVERAATGQGEEFRPSSYTAASEILPFRAVLGCRPLF